MPCGVSSCEYGVTEGVGGQALRCSGVQHTQAAADMVHAMRVEINPELAVPEDKPGATPLLHEGLEQVWAICGPEEGLCTAQ